MENILFEQNKRIKQLEEENLTLKRQLLQFLRNDNTSLIIEKMKNEAFEKEIAMLKRKLAMQELYN